MVFKQRIASLLVLFYPVKERKIEIFTIVSLKTAIVKKFVI